MDDSSSTVDSLLTSSSSSLSFVHGPGAITGKFLKALGEKSLDLVISAIVRTHLTAIEQTLERHPGILMNPVGAKERQKMNSIYADLSELCSDSIETRKYYSRSVKRRAANLILDITKVTRGVQGRNGLAEASPTNKEWESLLARVQQRMNPFLESLDTKLAIPSSWSINNRILVLGAKGVGKTTVVKQILANVLDPSFRYIRDDDEYRKAIFDNVKISIGGILAIKDNQGSLGIVSLNSMVTMLRRNIALNPITGKFRLLPGSSPESYESYLSSLDRILESDYVPSQEDYLRVSIPTRGTYETVVSFPKFDFAMKLYDVGGRWSAEHTKWRHKFQDPVAALIFVVALSDYNKNLEETPGINRVADSLDLFGYIANLEELQSTTIILLFNKLDTFEEELADHPFVEFFPYYTGDTVQDACKYLEGQFIGRLLERNRPLVIDYICAVDSNAMSETFKTVLWPHLSLRLP